MNSQPRGFSSLIVLLIIVVALILSVGYIGAKHNIGSTETATSTPEATTTNKLFLSFNSPIREQVVDPNKGMLISWSYPDRSVLNKLPPQYTWVVFSLAKEDGEDTHWQVGQAHVASSSYRWNTKAEFNQNLGHGLTLEPPYRYRIKAKLVYGPKDFTCDPNVHGECSPVFSQADQELMNEASSTEALSPVFTIDMSKWVPQVVTVDRNPTTVTASNPSVRGSSNMDTIVLQLLLPHSTPNVTVPVINGRWAYTPANDIPNGTFAINIWDKTEFDSFDSVTVIVAR